MKVSSSAVKWILGVGAGIVFFLNFTIYDSSTSVTSADIDWRSSFIITKTMIQQQFTDGKKKIADQLSSQGALLALVSPSLKKDVALMTTFTNQLKNFIAAEFDANLNDQIDPVLLFMQPKYEIKPKYHLSCLGKENGKLKPVYCASKIGDQFEMVGEGTYSTKRIPWKGFAYQEAIPPKNLGNIDEANLYRLWRWDIQNIQNHLLQGNSAEILLRKSSSQLNAINRVNAWVKTYQSGQRDPVLVAFDNLTTSYPAFADLPAFAGLSVLKGPLDSLHSFEYELFEDFVATHIAEWRIQFLNQFITFLQKNQAALKEERYLNSQKYIGMDILPINFNINSLTNQEKLSLNSAQIEAVLKPDVLRIYTELRDQIGAYKLVLQEKSKKDLATFNQCATVVNQSLSAAISNPSAATVSSALSKWGAQAAFVQTKCKPNEMDKESFSAGLEEHLLTTALVHHANAIMKQFQIEMSYQAYLNNNKSHPVIAKIIEIENLMTQNADVFTNSRFLAKDASSSARIDVGSTLRKMVHPTPIQLPANFSALTLSSLNSLLDFLKKQIMLEKCAPDTSRMTKECREVQSFVKSKGPMFNSAKEGSIDKVMARVATELKILPLYQANHVYGVDLVSYFDPNTVKSRMLAWQAFNKNDDD